MIEKSRVEDVVKALHVAFRNAAPITMCAIYEASDDTLKETLRKDLLDKSKYKFSDIETQISRLEKEALDTIRAYVLS